MIGVFDSGIGGLTVVRELFKQLPDYDLAYFGDTARTPYGNKSPKTVRRFAVEDARFLAKKGAKLIIIACNTVSATALNQVRRAVPVPVFEVVTPAVTAAVSHLQPNGKLGVIGTRATVKSGVYEQRVKRERPKAKIVGRPCPLFVPLVEEGWLKQPVTAAVANRYLSSLRWPKVDILILGCTHYPFLRPVIRRTVGPKTRLIDPARETVRQVKEFLAARPELDRDLPKRDRHLFYVSDLTDHYQRLASDWLGRPVQLNQARLDSCIPS